MVLNFSLPFYTYWRLMGNSCWLRVLLHCTELEIAAWQISSALTLSVSILILKSVTNIILVPISQMQTLSPQKLGSQDIPFSVVFLHLHFHWDLSQGQNHTWSLRHSTTTIGDHSFTWRGDFKQIGCLEDWYRASLEALHLCMPGRCSKSSLPKCFVAGNVKD